MKFLHAFFTQNKTGKVVTLRDLLNLRSHQTKQSNIEHQTELESVIESIQSNDDASIVEVAVSEDSNLVGIYFQVRHSQKNVKTCSILYITHCVAF